MYGFEFNIKGNTAVALSAMAAGMKQTQSQATALQAQLNVVKMPVMELPKNPFRDIVPSAAQVNAQASTPGPGINMPPPLPIELPNEAPLVSVAERMSNITMAALDIQRAFEWMQMPLENAPERITNIRQSIVDTLIAARSGNFAEMVSAATSGFDEVLGMVNDFRTTWDFAKQGFAGAKTIFNETWAIFSQNAVAAIAQARTIGTTFLTQTLPSFLSFVGRGVLSMGGFVASLMGATGAQTALNVVMAANPIGVIVMGVVAVGAAVYGLITYWDTVKTWLVNFTQFFFKYSPFGFLLEITDRLFPGFKAAVYDTFGKIYEWIDKYFIQPIKWAIGWLSDQASSIANDVNAAFATVQPEVMVQPVVDTEVAKASAEALKKGNLKLPKQSNIGLDKRAKIATETPRGEVKNINITVGSVGSNMTVVNENGTTLSERQFKELFTRLWMDVINQSNYQ